MQNDTHTRLSDAALPVAAKDLETNQVSIHKAKSMTEHPDRMLYSCKKRVARLSMDHGGGKAKVSARVKSKVQNGMKSLLLFVCKKKKRRENKATYVGIG